MDYIIIEERAKYHYYYRKCSTLELGWWDLTEAERDAIDDYLGDDFDGEIARSLAAGHQAKVYLY